MNRTQKFVTDVNWEFTKRVVLRSALSVPFWVGFLCVVGILTVSGPFETSTLLNTPQRFAYWFGICFFGYFIGVAVSAISFARLQSTGMTDIFCILASGIISAGPVGVFVYLLNTEVAGIMVAGQYEFLYILSVCMLITVFAALMHYFICPDLISSVSRKGDTQRRDAQPNVSASAAPASSSVLMRLSPANRGVIQSLRAQDHYVEVTTSSGKELLLMRLSDALDEVAGFDGMRVHRSWWVAKSSVSKVKHDGEKVSLELVDGRNVPVSRAQEGMVKDWLGYYGATTP